MTYADSCEERLQSDAVFATRACKGKGLRIVVHPDGVTRKVMCSSHSIKAYASGYVVDWDATKATFGNSRPKGQLRGGIDRG